MNKVGPREIKSTLEWEGGDLVISSKFVYNDADVNARANWALSPDGKTLTISVHFASTLGETDQKFVYEKQETAAAPAPAKTP